MKKSKYLMEIENNGELVLINSLYGSIITFNSEYREKYRHILEGNREGLEEIANTLFEEKILYDSAETEEIELRELMTTQEQSTLALTIMPTTACNMQCVYCFEHLSPLDAAESLSEDVISFVDDFYHKKKFSNISITWFGGEPLLRTSMIFDMSRKLMSYAQKRGIRYSANIITNGILLTDKLVKKFKEECGVTYCQITLDGLADQHNKRRPYGNKDGFSIIINNIRECCDMINIVVRINVDKENEASLNSFLSFFDAEQKIKEKVFFYLGNVVGERPVCMKSDEFDKANQDFIRLLITYGFHASVSNLSLRGKLIPCGSISEQAFVVYPNGDLYKCLEVVGNKKFCIGNIKAFKTNYTNLIKNNYNTDDICKECNMYPYCTRNACPYRQKTLKSDNCKEVTGSAIKDYVSLLGGNVK